MCGRFTLIRWEDMIERFGVFAESLKPRYNIAPTQTVPVIIRQQRPKLQHFRWGLVPSWAKDLSIGSRLINARAETVDKKNSFRQSFIQKRCLIPADGFYEWEKTGKTKVPYRYILKNGDLFAFAGLWDEWLTPEGNKLQSFCIITTSANALIAKVHERMPVILAKEHESTWLDPNCRDTSVLKEMLVPYPAEEMAVYKANPLVNNPSNDSSAVL